MRRPVQADVEEHVGGPDGDVEGALKQVQDSLACVLSSIHTLHDELTVRLGRKYRYMDANLQQRRANLEEKIPDIRKTLTMVEYLNERRVRCR